MKLTPFHIIDAYVDRNLKRSGLQLHVLEADGYTVEYWASDVNKPALLLLHAFGASGKYSWFKQVKQLSKQYRLIVPNLLYFGRSDMEQKAYRVSDQVEAIRVLLDHLSTKEFTLGGASYGGVVASELAATDAYEIQKMFLSNAPVKYALQSDWEPIIRAFGVEKKSEVLIPLNHKQLRDLYNASQHKSQFVPAFAFREIYQKLYVPKAEDRRKLVDSFVEEHPEFSERNYDFDFPVLLVWGTRDQLAPVRIGEQLKSHIGENARLEIIHKAGHMPNFERPKAYNRILLEFLKNEH